jgi:uncharacterized protein (TIGR03435 family)
VLDGLMNRFVFVVLCCVTAALAGQEPAAPAFEAASVKSNISGATAQSNQVGKGSAAFTNIRMRALINSAYGVRPDRIVGSPEWFDRERFDIIARAPADTPDNLLRPMLRTLLAERFRFVAHTEMREVPVYALVVNRGDGRLGPNLLASTQCDEALGPRAGDAALPIGKRPCRVITGSDGRGAYITGGARTVAALVDALQLPGGLQELVGRPVVDRTGLTGTYDFYVRFASAGLGAAFPDTSNLPSIFTALQEQLGLKLESARGSVEMLVIDSVERPTPD